MATATKYIPGIVGTRRLADARRWIDVDAAALRELAVEVGSKVMVHCNDGDIVPGVLVDAGDGALAVHVDFPIYADAVRVRRRGYST